MKEETRYRVTGSLFLLAVAVICLPMLLDGEGLPAREPAPLSLPDTLEAAPTEAADSVPQANDYLKRVDRLREQVDNEGFLTDSGTRFGEPVLNVADAGTRVWAVQVASFAGSENAERFRQRLREDGYEAFISTARSSGRVLSRVAVGPLLDEDRAATLRDELSARYDVQARLMGLGT